ncbi:High-affinity zinc uptake system binding-protein ZnuA precursor [Caloramator mitchellensis]|uniref:High-affinity zinc uptake system binding-protein ZnuA n=1 Tax=Caloramator mitchellensis TaxID=908809 RepID=A0A0R3K1G9_CALMK|nr:zinc ABC transporter substrate-binding protein [Caloramator mitchellensis]KRQ87100.1 High-affinity zinc uptake system binding-protein ZnuA precursor [Caloramator mitchellensis]
MKVKIFALLLVVGLIFTSCAKTVQKQNVIYTTIYPVYSIAKFIAGDKIEVERIVKGAAEPHSFEPQTQDIAKMIDAKAVLYLGIIDEWAKKASEGGNENVFKVSEGIVFVDDDPHVWTSPKNAIVIAQNIKNALIAIDEQNKGVYERNYDEFVDKMQKLDYKMKAEKTNFKRSDFVIAHPSFGYLAREYNLNQISVTGQEEVEEPSPKLVSDIINFIKDKNIKHILYDRTENENIIRPIIEATGVQKIEIYGMGAVPSDIEEKDNFITLMEKNIDNIIKALK